MNPPPTVFMRGIHQALGWLLSGHFVLVGVILGWVVLLGLVRGRRPLWPPFRGVSHPKAAQRQAGQVGESRTTRVFCHQLPQASVWPNVHVATGHRTSQCDHLVYGPFGLVVVETKHWTGTLSRINADHWLQATASGVFKLYESPESQNAYHCHVVSAVLRQHGLQRIPIYGAIVLSNPRAEFISESGPMPIGTPDQIVEWIQQLPPAIRLRQATRVEAVLRRSGAGIRRTIPWG